MSSAEEIILSGCISNSIEKIKDKIKKEFFLDKFYKKVFQRTFNFYLTNNCAMSKEALSLSFEDGTQEDQVRLSVLLSNLNPDIELSILLQTIENFRKSYQIKKSKELAQKILNEGYDSFTKLITEVNSELTEIESLTENVPKFQNLMTEKGRELMKKDLDSYSDINNTTKVYCGIKEIDDITGGVKQHQLMTIAALSGHGKSTLLINWCYYAAITLKLNCCFFTAEMSAKEIRTAFLTLHAYEKFGMNELDSHNLINGKLTKADQIKLKEEVVEDFNNNYGNISLIEAGQLNIKELHAMALEINKKFSLSALFIDYAMKLGTLNKRYSKKEEIESTFKYLEHMKNNFSGGEKGIMICTGHQINRTAIPIGKKTNGHFSYEHLYGTSSIEQNSDIVISAYNPMCDCITEDNESNRMLLLNFMKNRNGEIYTRRTRDIEIGVNWRVKALKSIQKGIFTGIKELDADLELDE